MTTHTRTLVAGLLLSIGARHAAALENSGNYFYYPAISAPVPQVIAGDTLKVSWSSNYTNGDLYVHCNGTQGLNGTATESITIRDTWESPCHFQVGITDGYGWFDSGYIQIVDEDRDTTTWGVTNQCLQTTSTSSGATATATSSSSSSATAAGAASEGTTTCPPGEGSGPGMGAGIGIGIGISAGAAAIPLLLMFLRRMKKRQQSEKLPPSAPGAGEYYNGPTATAGTTEIQSHEYSELSGNGNLIELDGQHGRKR
ncbi:hypothetical protein SLS58_008770 [Diplodia intermedia]|uniref:Uncharacterized protein n=1 Tax=Diplodia intermedia TaxID=856260 RepID=A0ABR3TGJ7_9PEZI